MLWKGIVTIKDNDTPFSKQFTRNGAVLSVNRAGKVHAVRSATAVHVTRTVDVPASSRPATTSAGPTEAQAAGILRALAHRRVRVATSSSKPIRWPPTKTSEAIRLTIASIA